MLKHHHMLRVMQQCNSFPSSATYLTIYYLLFQALLDMLGAIVGEARKQTFLERFFLSNWMLLGSQVCWTGSESIPF